MISICIPIYNCDVRALVDDLKKQCADSLVGYEILLLDDASTDTAVARRNSEMADSKTVFYDTNVQNIGLSRTRNRLSQWAKHPYLLFIDSDAQVVMHDYITRYLKVCQSGVACFGGCVYSDKCEDHRYTLRWKYGKEREEGVGKYYSCFNFLIDRNLLLEHPFSENLHRYGYEDTLLGIELEDNRIDILFIDNPLLHKGLVTSQEFIEKINSSLHNLLLIEELLKEKGIEPSIKLLKTAGKLKKMGMQTFVVFLWNMFKNACINNLNGNNPSLFLLDFYKLGYFCNLKQKK